MPLPARAGAAVIQRESVGDRAFQTLQEAILDGTLRPGEELRDDALIAWLGVSRTPVRDALRRLDDLGLVETVPNRYSRVAEMDAGAINQANDAMSVFYEHLLRTQVPVSDVGRWREMDDVAAVWRGRKPDRMQVTISVFGYFSALAKASGNDVLLASMDSLEPVLRRSLAARDGLYDIELIIEKMAAVHEAVQAGDGQLAADRVYELFEPTRRNFLERFRPSDTELDARHT